MKIQELIKTQSELLWRFMGFFQSPFLRVLHALVVLFVILQLCSSTLMRVTPDGASWTAWYHMLEGMSLCVLGVIVAAYSLGKHGLKYFFPYLWGDVDQIRKDLIASLHGRLVAPRPGGLATSVQGLGLGALLLTAFSGLARDARVACLAGNRVLHRPRRHGLAAFFCLAAAGGEKVREALITDLFTLQLRFAVLQP